MWQCVKCREQVEDDFDVCWNCGTARDGTEDPDFRKAEDVPAAALAGAERPADTGPPASEPAPEAPETPKAVTCPICGSSAERGCVYGSDRGFSLRWYAGPPGFWGNLVTGFGGGGSGGGWGFGSGPDARRHPL